MVLRGGRLPAEAYLSADVLQWEVEHFFAAAWVCVGRANDLGTPGDQQAVRVGDQGIVVGRDEDRRRTPGRSETLR